MVLDPGATETRLYKLGSPRDNDHLRRAHPGEAFDPLAAGVKSLLIPIS